MEKEPKQAREEINFAQFTTKTLELQKLEVLYGNDFVGGLAEKQAKGDC